MPPALVRAGIFRETGTSSKDSPGWEGEGFPDRRGERAVECCPNQNGAYYHDLTRPG